MDLFRPDVVAGKYDAKKFDTTGQDLLINEIFYSLQGEGRHAGEATVFIRLAKCNLACKFCDTEFETYTVMSYREVVAKVLALVPERQPRPWIDITGGEPLLQNCEPLIRSLHSYHFKVGAETSGSVWADWVRELDWLTCSPKVPYGRIPSKLVQALSQRVGDVTRHGGEVKWIVNAPFLSQFEKAPSEFFVPDVFNYLQPESNNPKWITAASKLCLTYPTRYTLSLQTHKLAGNP